ncbi:lysoplasmalogenase [Miniphocaeibacter halophilus]|uniref:Lysoplasmalogenase n=1 Tax=Miniphocaeibacter halophilus TaxID=2931922 RepID=A0AC61MS65_9FIRM|nr:lysoplasmalogenase [Miniphocaeibacter halophilus]QQK08282.1 lysoplasmalogenase [Miniphocaeibacter halophilus]
MKYFVSVFSIIYIITLIYLLWVSKKRKDIYLKVKTLTSSLFIFNCCMSFYFGGGNFNIVFLLLILGLVFCLIGDVFLGFNKNRVLVNVKFFKAGVISFSLAHILFCIIFYSIIGFFWFDLILPVILVLIALFCEKRNLVRLKKLKKIVNIYAVIIGVMATKAIEVAMLGNLIKPHGVLLTVGAGLFLFSDIVLFFVYFGTKKKHWLSLVNLFMYYMGCYFLGLTAYYL